MRYPQKATFVVFLGTTLFSWVPRCCWVLKSSTNKAPSYKQESHRQQKWRGIWVIWVFMTFYRKSHFQSVFKVKWCRISQKHQNSIFSKIVPRRFLGIPSFQIEDMHLKNRFETLYHKNSPPSEILRILNSAMLRKTRFQAIFERKCATHKKATCVVFLGTTW